MSEQHPNPGRNIQQLVIQGHVGLHQREFNEARFGTISWDYFEKFVVVSTILSLILVDSFWYCGDC